MTEEQINAVRCAYLDLLGAMEGRDDPFAHDWREHKRTIDELAKAFKTNLADLIKENKKWKS